MKVLALASTIYRIVVQQLGNILNFLFGIVILITICLVVLSYGCSKELDTTTKESSGYWTIKRWDGDNWIDTADQLSIDRTWRFISHTELNDKSVQIKGGYTLEAYNPSDNDVEFGFNKIIFEDKDGIPIYEDRFRRIERNVGANITATYSGEFEMELDNIDIANQIKRMTIRARVFHYR